MALNDFFFTPSVVEKSRVYMCVQLVSAQQGVETTSLDYESLLQVLSGSEI